jgi:hypothetical protein
VRLDALISGYYRFVEGVPVASEVHIKCILMEITTIRGSA